MRALPITAAALALLLAACSTGSQMQLRMLESYNQLRVSPSTAADHDFMVEVGNTGDLGYNPDELAVRNKVALAATADACPNATVVGETQLARGTIPIQNKPAITYFIKVKCR